MVRISNPKPKKNSDKEIAVVGTDSQKEDKTSGSDKGSIATSSATFVTQNAILRTGVGGSFRTRRNGGFATRSRRRKLEAK